MRVIEREQGHYEVQEVPHGKVYSWRPEQVLFECDCGETLTWNGGHACHIGHVECRCGAAYEDFGRERVNPEEKGAHRPWLEEYEEWMETKTANGIKREYFGFVGEKSGA